MASMIDKCVELGWEEESNVATCEDAVIEACSTYEDLGRLIAELLAWNGGTGDVDDRVVQFAANLLGQYIDDVCPQPQY